MTQRKGPQIIIEFTQPDGVRFNCFFPAGMPTEGQFDIAAAECGTIARVMREARLKEQMAFHVEKAAEPIDAAPAPQGGD